MDLSIIIPAYNEEKTIGLVLQKLKNLNLNGIKKEIIVVDDGSTDNTTGIVKEKKKNDKDLILIEKKINGGKGTAVLEGIKKSKGEVILIQDADLEYNPEDIPKLLKPIKNKSHHVVYGTRLRTNFKIRGKDKTPLPFHFIGNKFLSLMTSILYGEKITDMETGYKVFTRKSIDGIILESRSFDFEPEITAKILKKGIKIHEIDIKIKPRSYEEGKKIRPINDGLIALWTLIKYRFKS